MIPRAAAAALVLLGSLALARAHQQHFGAVDLGSSAAAGLALRSYEAASPALARRDDTGCAAGFHSCTSGSLLRVCPSKAAGWLAGWDWTKLSWCAAPD